MSLEVSGCQWKVQMKEQLQPLNPITNSSDDKCRPLLAQYCTVWEMDPDTKLASCVL